MEDRGSARTSPRGEVPVGRRRPVLAVRLLGAWTTRLVFVLGLALGSLAHLVVHYPWPAVAITGGLLSVLGVGFGWLTSEALFLVFVATLPLIGFSLLNIGFGLQPSYAVGLLLLMSAMVRSRTFMTGKVRFAQTPINGAIVAFIVVAIVSVAMSGIIPPTRVYLETPYLKSLKQVGSLVLMVSLYHAVTISVTSSKLAARGLRVLTWVALLTSVYGLYQFVGYYITLPLGRLPLNNSSFHIMGPDYWHGLGRINATAPESLMLGNFLLAALPLLLAMRFRRVRFPTPLPWFNSFCLAIILMALVLTFARGAYLGLIAALGVLLVYQPGKVRFLREAIGLAVLVGLSLVGSTLMARVIGLEPISLNAILARMLSIGSREDLANLERWTMIVTAFRIFLRYPILGIGIGNFGFFYASFAPSWGWTVDPTFPSPNNLVMSVLAEMGVCGLVALAWFVRSIVLEGTRLVRRTQGDDFWNAVALGLLAGFVGIMIQLLTVATLSFSHIWFIVAMIVALKHLACKEVIPCLAHKTPVKQPLGSLSSTGTVKRTQPSASNPCVT